MGKFFVGGRKNILEGMVVKNKLRWGGKKKCLGVGLPKKLGAG